MVAPWISERALATHPEVFSLSEIILEAHRSLAQKLRGSGEVERMKTSRLLRSFVPKLVRQDVAAHDANLRQRDARGAVLFADASGFTALTQSLCADKDGAERLTGILNDFFGVLIDLVESYGGDVVQFSGDALTIL
ncbi:adenylate and guanylate cyclase, partial [Aureococcus anophagefferens]